MYGLKQNIILIIQQVFKKYRQVEKVLIYGSRAKGNYRNGSDIDFVLQGDKLALTLLNKIENDLDDLLLPYKIDISILNQINNPELLEQINIYGKVFYVKEES